MRLQEVLKEREAEIMALESSLKSTQDDSSVTSSPAISTPGDASPSTPSAKLNGHAPEGHLSPKTLGHFDHIRRSMELNGHDVGLNDSESDRNDSVNSEADESLERLNELMLYVFSYDSTFASTKPDFCSSMAQKESQHRELVEGLNSELLQVRRQHDELTALSRDQVCLAYVLRDFS